MERACDGIDESINQRLLEKGEQRNSKISGVERENSEPREQVEELPLEDAVNTESINKEGPVKGKKKSTPSYSTVLLASVTIVLLIGCIVPWHQQAQSDPNFDNPWDHNTTLSKTLYDLKGDRHAMIKLYLNNRIEESTYQMKLYKEMTMQMGSDIKFRITKNEGYESGVDRQGGQTLRKLECEVKAREEYAQCMAQRVEELKKWTNWNTVSKWTMSDSFDFKELVLAHGWCKDRNECLCDVLMARVHELENALRVNQEMIAERMQRKENDDK